MVAVVDVENPIWEKVQSGASGQTFALPVANQEKSVRTDGGCICSHVRVNSQKGPQVGTSNCSFFLINPIVRTV